MALAVCGSWNGGNATLYIIGPDNITWLSAINPLTANGGGIVDLPPGQFCWVLTGVVNAYLSITRVPVGE